jgi:dTDP-4-amino-4,6-dideoxygalactose transaminase
MIPFFDTKQENIPYREAIDKAIESVLDSGIYLLGEQTDAFEREFSQYNKIDHTVSVGSGTAALTLMFQASMHLAMLEPGDEVIVPTNSFTASAMAISQAGLQPVFADVDPVTLNLSQQALQSALTENTRAVLAVHLCGQSCNIDLLNTFCQENNLLLYEDAAQSLGAQWQGQLSGSHGIASAFSFYPTKNLGSLGNAGAVATRSAELATTIRKLRNYGGIEKYSHELVGSNSRVDEFQAAVLRVKLPFVNHAIARRCEIAKRYNEHINSDIVSLPHYPYEATSHTWHLYMVRSAHRSKIINYLRKQDIHCGIHYPVCIHKQEAYSSAKQKSLPHAERAAEEIFSLPNFAALTDSQVSTVVDAINRYA